jgi:tetratricopeptide (TPR) repeat protein
MDPDTTRALLRLQGTLAQQTGDMDAAVKQYEEILRLDPLDAETMLLLADIRHDQGQLEEAVMTLERAARVKGFEADALVRQAQIEVERERYGRAVELLESAQAFRDQPHVARYLEQVRRLAR